MSITPQIDAEKHKRQLHQPWVADWLNENAYPSSADESCLTQCFRWEFMRRNIDYPAAQQQWNASLRSALELEEYIEPTSDIRPCVELLNPLRRELIARWGVFSSSLWPYPKNSRGARQLQFVAVGPHVTIRPFYDDDLTQSRLVLSNSGPHDVWIKFDLSQPLGSQLETAKRSMEMFFDGSDVESAPRSNFRTRDPQVLTRLLRTFDAVARGVKRSEIARVLHPRIENVYPDFAAEDRVAEDLDIAKELVASGFQSLRVKGGN